MYTDEVAVRRNSDLALFCGKAIAMDKFFLRRILTNLMELYDLQRNDVIWEALESMAIRFNTTDTLIDSKSRNTTENDNVFDTLIGNEGTVVTFSKGKDTSKKQVHTTVNYYH